MASLQDDKKPRIQDDNKGRERIFFQIVFSLAAQLYNDSRRSSRLTPSSVRVALNFMLTWVRGAQNPKVSLVKGRDLSVIKCTQSESERLVITMTIESIECGANIQNIQAPQKRLAGKTNQSVN